MEGFALQRTGLGKKLVCNMANDRIVYRVMPVKPREILFENALSMGVASHSVTRPFHTMVKVE